MNRHRVSKSEAQRRAKATMAAVGRWDFLPTMAEVNARPRAVPKPSAAAREDAKAKSKRSDRGKLSRWAVKVKDRDGWIDRYDGQPVMRSAEFHPRRGEAHHIAPKGNLAVRYDVRNGICLSADVHAQVEANRLTIVGTEFFTVDGKRYIDATHRVIFRRTECKRAAGTAAN